MSNFTQIDGKWYTGCSCNGSKKEQIPPVNSKAVLVLLSGQQVGPVTGIRYNIMPNQASIDIDVADADAWIAEGKARLPLPGHKGRFARVTS